MNPWNGPQSLSEVYMRESSNFFKKLKEKFPTVPAPVFLVAFMITMMLNGTVGFAILSTRRDENNEFSLSRQPEMYLLVPLVLVAWMVLSCCVCMNICKSGVLDDCSPPDCGLFNCG